VKTIPSLLLSLSLLLPAGARGQEGGCGEISNCRRVTAAEDASLRSALTALERALPAPEAARWERAATSDGMAERQGRAPGRPLFWECNPTWKGCFPKETEVTIGYQAKGSADAARKKTERRPKDPLAALLEAGAAAADAMQYGVSTSVRLVPHPVDNGCFEDEGYPRPLEKAKDFLLEWYDSDGQATASLVFGERACREPEEWPEVSAGTPMAPVRAVVVELRGPTAEVKRLAAAVDRKVFAARLGPVVR